MEATEWVTILILGGILEMIGQGIRVIVGLNIRKGVPNTRASVHQTVQRGTILSYIGIVEDGEPVNGNPVWHADNNGNFFWSGGAIAQYWHLC